MDPPGFSYNGSASVSVGSWNVRDGWCETRRVPIWTVTWPSRPDEGETSLKDLQGRSITYRIALGPHKGRKAFMLQSLPPLTGERAGEPVAQAAGFSLHAGAVRAVPSPKGNESPHLPMIGCCPCGGERYWP